MPAIALEHYLRCITVHCSLLRGYTHSLVSIIKNPDNIFKETSKGPDQNERGATSQEQRLRGESPTSSIVPPTPEGKPVCYRYNNPQEKCKAKKCRFEHVWGLCFSPKHPMHACDAKNRQDDAQGTV